LFTHYFLEMQRWRNFFLLSKNMINILMTIHHVLDYYSFFSHDFKQLCKYGKVFDVMQLHYITNLKLLFMKTIITAILILITFKTNAQLGMMGNLATSLISSAPQNNLTGQLFATAAITAPVSLSNKLTGGKIIVPPIHLTVEYGIYQNMTLGAMVGYTSSKSPTVNSLIGGTNDLLSLANTIGIDFSDVTNLLLNGSNIDSIKNNYNYSYNINSTLLGVIYKYNFKGGPKLNYYLGTRVGIKNTKTSKIDGDRTNATNDIIAQTASNASATFYSGMIGFNYYLDAKNEWAFTADAGGGNGLGDGIGLGNSSIFLTLGITKRLK
jgi:hypothetical protein